MKLIFTYPLTLLPFRVMNVRAEAAKQQKQPHRADCPERMENMESKVITEYKSNVIDELAEMARDRWNGTKEEKEEKEQILSDLLSDFSSDRQPICDREEALSKTEEQKAAQRAAFSLFRMAAEERMQAKAMLEAPEDHQ